jgi:hypothetical protein
MALVDMYKRYFDVFNSDHFLMPNVLHYIATIFRKGRRNFFGNCIHFDELSSSGIFSLFSSVGKNENAAS